MKRSMRRHIEAAINQTWNPRRSERRGQVAVVLSFPEDAFAGAPRWSPGPDFTPTAGEYAWLRDNGDGTSTAVVAGVGPKELPGLDGGEWADPEVWTATAPNDSIFMDSGAMWDKPHRITWLLREPRAVVHRELYSTHPSADVHAYWETFEERWGFFPGRMHRGEFPFADRRRFVVLHTEPGVAALPSEVQLLDVAVTLMRTFGARARAYAYDPQRRNTRDPMNTVSDYTLSSVLRCRERPAARR
ncbi:hypothetical protein MHW47_00250 [Streptomyces sp. OfavH-34-F]|uniref:hypothetical protein n=1 Tax=Streptomyces sp. OfavH-34-F TaxID=2917760 RepID=UPI001EF19127|nr:hypothetical protein [Streptomyces sp. OfavH-34-F]MCG7522886.1 hypothetical protein [Streptomyces sp. OfavH-34-F]